MRLRTEKAQLLGYDCSADQILNDKMAHDHATVDAFLSKIMTKAVARAKKEIVSMQEFMDKDIAAGLLPAGSTIQPWDWWFYSEKVRKAQYDLDENITKQYFQLENVRNGVFKAAEMLYGIKIEPVKGLPVYNPEVETFKVFDADNSLLGIFLTDYLPRSTKRGGAWMNNFREQYVDASGKDIRPIVVNVCNFGQPEDTVKLLTIDEVQTAFHEFGHALHGLLTKCHYVDVSGTSVARDFVETFSQFNENWAFQPEILAKYAFHYQTGEVIPDSLVTKINNAAKFNQGFMTTELCAASILDMKWHELGPDTDWNNLDIEAFEKNVCREMGLIDQIIPRYRSTYFNHTFGGGYSAGYYGYLYRMSLNQTINFMKKNKFRNSSLLADIPYDQMVEEVIDMKDKEAFIASVVERMPEQRRKVFVMSRFENRSNDEIASMLHIKKKTVENHLNLALKELRTALPASVFLFIAFF